MLDPLKDQLVVFAVEGRVAAEEDVEDHSAAPDVALLVVLSFEDLGRDVVGGAGSVCSTEVPKSITFTMFPSSNDLLLYSRSRFSGFRSR